MKTVFKSILFSLAALSLTATTYAAVVTSEHLLAEHCQLGELCTIPANDEGITYYYITPATGTAYHCRVDPASNTLYFAVYGGKDFVIKQGNGIYQTDSGQAFSIDIKGEFPNQGDGQIKFKKIQGSGKVKCEKAG